ncbi:hypothetical protein GCM10010517_33480 [Streptosporangium fragile]|uniref:Histidine kinase/HSP90-like ATPase domain-containing protein n=1 Tax=Streptosporangium fragile TaxID=46186 RepID=A0ABP6IDM6_9ACTN
MATRLLSVLVGAFTDRFRATTGLRTATDFLTATDDGIPGPARPDTMWSPRLGHAPVMSPMISRRFAATPDQVRPARNFVAEILGDGHPLCDDALLLTSELATNAVEHSAGPAEAGSGNRPREFVVTAASVPHGVLITVQDLGSSQIPHLRNSGPDATDGRGLMLVNSLATRWGFHRDSIGTVIWFELGSTN